jgi:hypothetical protein
MSSWLSAELIKHRGKFTFFMKLKITSDNQITEGRDMKEFRHLECLISDHRHENIDSVVNKV